MTLVFNSLEAGDDGLKIVFKREGTVLSLKDEFDGARGKAALVLEFDAESFASQNHADISPVQRGAALDALICHKVETDPSYDAGKKELPISERELGLLQRGRIVEAMSLQCPAAKL
jgi:hypothetical protein